MGPLQGVTIVEIASIGPGPMCGMLLSDMGARVIRVDRLEDSGLGLNIPPELDALARGRESIALDLKSETGREIVLKLIEKADGLIEGFRPGVMERLGLGPDVALARNPRLVFGRMTGFGQNGPLAHAAGHDINYIALSGALDAIGRKGEKPVPPLNLVGDFGGGALYLAMGLLAGILHARATGKGDVVDAAMVDGAASLLAMFSGLRAAGQWRDERGVNILDTGAPWYDTYETSDGLYMAIGAIEPKFFRDLARLIGLGDDDIKRQYDESHWPDLRARLTQIFKSNTRAHWTALLEGSDACATPVLSLAEAGSHPHMAARGSFEMRVSFEQPAPAPRFAHAGRAAPTPSPAPGAHTDAVRPVRCAEAPVGFLKIRTLWLPEPLRPARDNRAGSRRRDQIQR